MKELWAEKLKEKLQDHEVEQIPEGLWAGIEQELDAPVPMVVPFYKRKAVWSAAALILFLMLGGSLALHFQHEEAPLVAQQIENGHTEEESPSHKEEKEILIHQPTPTLIAPAETEPASEAEAETGHEETETGHEEADQAPAETQDKAEIPNQDHAAQEDKPVPPLSSSMWDSRSETLLPSAASRSGNITLALAASGINVNLDFLTDLGNDDLYAGSGPLGSDQLAAPGLPNRPDYTEKPAYPVPTEVTEDHERPVSIGLQVGIPLGNSWWVSTGLSYTYAKSTIKQTTATSSIIKEQELHFVGIPVALNHSLYKDESWHIYAGAGTRMDVGKVVYISVSATPGIQYHLKGGMNLYAEPSLQYNIPTSERYRTYYNTHRWMGDFRVGLRWIFNKK